MRLLVVEDDPDLNRQLVSALSDAGYAVDTAFDGEEGHFLGDTEPYDAVVLDLGLPKKDGLSVLEQWRRDDRKMPVLILTARERWSDKVAGMDAGADDYVAKPFHMEEVLARLRALLADYETKLTDAASLVARVRHEINNPLNFAKTALYVLRIMTESLGGNEKKEFREVLEDMGEGINRISSIVSDLRTFTQPHLTQLETVSVTEVVNSALRLLSNEWENKVRVEKEIPEHQTIWANRNQVTQVLVNLLQNALQALEKKHCSETEATICIRGTEENGESLIIIRDNGEGITSEDLQKIFDPFFTTKSDGTGLGLSISYGIVRDHHGTVDVQSRPGEGTTFVLTFPVSGASTTPSFASTRSSRLSTLASSSYCWSAFTRSPLCM